MSETPNSPMDDEEQQATDSILLEDLREGLSGERAKRTKKPTDFDIADERVREYLASRSAPNLRINQKKLTEGSLATYESRLNEWVNFAEAKGYDILTIPDSELYRFIIFSVNSGLGAGTVGDKLSIIKGLYKYIDRVEGYESVLCERDFEISPELYTDSCPPDIEKEHISEDEVACLFSAIDNDRDRLMVFVGLETGFRNSDIRNIKLKYTDLENQEITAHNPKGHNNAYTVPISKELALELQLWIHDGRESLAQNKDTEHLFLTATGSGHLKTNGSLWKIVTDAAEKAGIQEIISERTYNNPYNKSGKVHKKYNRVTPHTLRHTFITLLEEKGIQLEYRQLLANHANPSTTQRYSHAKAKKMREARLRANLYDDIDPVA